VYCYLNVNYFTPIDRSLNYITERGRISCPVWPVYNDAKTKPDLDIVRLRWASPQNTYGRCSHHVC